MRSRPTRALPQPPSPPGRRAGGGSARGPRRPTSSRSSTPRPRAAALSLDREGFVLVDHATDVDLWDVDRVASDYDPQIVRLISEVAGASRVHIFDHTWRSEDPDRHRSDHAREPVNLVHNDYTPWSARQRVLDLLPDEAQALLAGRFAVVQVWQPIRGPVRSSPLAICDAGSLHADDLIAARRVHPNRVGETYHVAYNPAHRWSWFPQMRTNEALVFKTFDSETDGRARFTAHASFALPDEAAPPRESLEVRALAFFG